MRIKSLSRAQLRAGLVERHADDHKGVYGHVMIVAGSRGMAGAAILAARAALHSGAGLVSVAIPEGSLHAVVSAIPSAMTLPLPENASGCFKPDGVELLTRYMAERRVTVMAIGPGLTTHPEAVRFTVRALGAASVPTVVDADALNALSSQDPEDIARLLQTRGAPCIFTPHPGEMSRILKCATMELSAQRVEAAKTLVEKWSGVVVLKGQETVIASSEQTVINATGGPVLAKGGSGDVLTGLIAGLWAQALASGRVTGDASFLSAALGVYLHGRAGEFAERKLTAWACSSTDLIDYLPEAFRSL